MQLRPPASEAAWSPKRLAVYEQRLARSPPFSKSSSPSGIKSQASSPPTLWTSSVAVILWLLTKVQLDGNDNSSHELFNSSFIGGISSAVNFLSSSSDLLAALRSAFRMNFFWSSAASRAVFSMLLRLGDTLSLCCAVLRFILIPSHTILRRWPWRWWETILLFMVNEYFSLSVLGSIPIFANSKRLTAGPSTSDQFAFDRVAGARPPARGASTSGHGTHRIGKTITEIPKDCVVHINEWRAKRQRRHAGGTRGRSRILPLAVDVKTYLVVKTSELTCRR